MLLRLLAFAFLSFCSLAYGAEQKFSISHLSANTVYFQGLIHTQSVQQLTAEFKPDTHFLLITSQGGELDSAIRLAHEVHQRRLTVIVKDYCLSACANYVFLAGSAKLMLRSSILGYHGAALGGISDNEIHALENESDSDGTAQDLLAWFNAMRSAELQFAREIGFSPDLYRATSDVVADYVKTKRLPARPAETTAIVTTAKGKRRIPIAQLDAEMDKLYKQGDFTAEARFTIQHSRAESIAFFPRKEMLERYGVGGITQYEYPASAAELERLGESKFKGVTFFGEFN